MVKVQKKNISFHFCRITFTRKKEDKKTVKRPKDSRKMRDDHRKKKTIEGVLKYHSLAPYPPLATYCNIHL